MVFSSTAKRIFLCVLLIFFLYISRSEIDISAVDEFSTHESQHDYFDEQLLSPATNRNGIYNIDKLDEETPNSAETQFKQKRYSFSTQRIYT